MFLLWEDWTQVRTLPHQIRPQEKNGDEAPCPSPPEKQTPHQNEPNYGEWMIVTRKRNQVKNGQDRGTKSLTRQAIPDEFETKGKVVIILLACLLLSQI